MSNYISFFYLVETERLFFDNSTKIIVQGVRNWQNIVGKHSRV